MECFFSLCFGGGRREKKLCKKRSKKGINTLQSRIPGRKKLLIANNLNMSWGGMACVHIGKKEKLAHEESEQALDCWKVIEIFSKDWDVFQTYFTLKQTVIWPGWHLCNHCTKSEGGAAATTLRGERWCRCCRCRTLLLVLTWGHPPHGQRLHLPKPGDLFWVQQTAHYQVPVTKDALTRLGRSKNSLSAWCQR